MKPIEEGCLAIVTYGHPENVGKEVRVGKVIGTAELIIGDDIWEVDTPMVTKNKKGMQFERFLQRECYMVRIDGYNEPIKERELEYVE